MIFVTMSDQQSPHRKIIQMIFQHMRVRVRPEIDLQPSVNHSAAPAPNFFAAVFPSIPAMAALAEQGRYALGSSRSHKQNLHLVYSPSFQDSQISAV